MKKLNLLLILFIVGVVATQAQIGYQISLLNTATGEPRVNETVSVSVSLSNKEGNVFYSETKNVTTNDFGVLSLTIGNADTFKNVDLTKMPFYISVSANGVMIGKSQILNVPVAEVAKTLAPLDIEEIVGTWSYTGRAFYSSYTFNRDYTVTEFLRSSDDQYTYTGTYFIYGNFITAYIDGNVCFFLKYENRLYAVNAYYSAVVYRRN